MILLQASENIAIDKIHQASNTIEEVLGDLLTDIVPAYDSIAAFTRLDLNSFINKLENCKLEDLDEFSKPTIYKIPICYEYGVDLRKISDYVGFSTEQVIKLHLQGTYRALFVGFTPGFIYADGLDPKLACPRKESPRVKIEAGSIGIAGGQTGIYSLVSPGGWNIIGKTPMKIFDLQKKPPMVIGVGATYRFERITIDEFSAWGQSE